MIPPKYLYTAIGSLALAIVSLLTMWGKDTSSRVTAHETRIQLLEQTEAVHTEQFKQIHRDLEDLKELLRANNRH